MFGTRLVRDWYAIKALIMSPVRDVRDFSLFFFGLIKFMAKYLKEGGRKNCVNRVIAYSGISKICLKMGVR